MGKSIHFNSKGKLTPLRLINPVIVMARIGERYDISKETLLHKTGLTPADLENPLKRITLNQERIIAERFIALVKVPWIGLEVGKEYSFSANGKLGLAMMCCDTLLDSLKLVLTYLPLTGSYHRYELRIDEKTGYARFEELINLEGFRNFCCEAEVSSIQAMAKASQITGSIFRELHFIYPEPSYADMYEELFQCPVYFNARCNRMVFDASHLMKPLPLANPLARTSLEQDCAQLLPLLQEHDSLASHILQELISNRDAIPDLDKMSQIIGISPRTLRRHLQKEKTSYSEIVSEFRKLRSIELLRNTNLTMEELSQRLGFSEVSSFYKAFRTWMGCTPNQFRKTNIRRIDN